MMKVLRQILLLTAITVGFSLTAMAQQNDPKKTPPKQDPPKIRVEDKKDRDKPKDDKKDNDRNNDRKRPDLALIGVSDEVVII